MLWLVARLLACRSCSLAFDGSKVLSATIFFGAEPISCCLLISQGELPGFVKYMISKLCDWSSWIKVQMKCSKLVCIQQGFCAFVGPRIPGVFAVLHTLCNSSLSCEPLLRHRRLRFSKASEAEQESLSRTFGQCDAPSIFSHRDGAALVLVPFPLAVTSGRWLSNSNYFYVWWQECSRKDGFATAWGPTPQDRISMSFLGQIVVLVCWLHPCHYCHARILWYPWVSKNCLGMVCNLQLDPHCANTRQKRPAMVQIATWSDTYIHQYPAKGKITWNYQTYALLFKSKLCKFHDIPMERTYKAVKPCFGFKSFVKTGIQ